MAVACRPSVKPSFMSYLSQHSRLPYIFAFHVGINDCKIVLNWKQKSFWPSHNLITLKNKQVNHATFQIWATIYKAKKLFYFSCDDQNKSVAMSTNMNNNYLKFVQPYHIIIILVICKMLPWAWYEHIDTPFHTLTLQEANREQQTSSYYQPKVMS